MRFQARAHWSKLNDRQSELIVTDSEIEVQVTPKISDAVRAAIDKIGRKDFASISGMEPDILDQLLSSEDAYVKVTLVSVACQINKSHSDPDTSHSSISECLKGAIYKIPQPDRPPDTQAPHPRRVDPEELRTRRSNVTFFDQKSVKILNFSANTASFLILGYFLGGIVLAPLFGLPQCVGLVSSSPWLAPCLGSGLGLVVGSIVGLVYTYYYFVKKL